MPSDRKFAFVALNGLDVSEALDGEVRLAPGLSVHRRLPFELDPHWIEWLGTLVVDRIKKSSLHLVAEVDTDTPKILDDGHAEVEKHVHDLYWCLHLVGFVRLEYAPVRASGSVYRDGKSELRSVGELGGPVVLIGSPFTQFGTEQIEMALRLQRNLEQMAKERVFSKLGAILEAFHVGIHTDRVDFRLHQFVRCVEGFISAARGATTRQFKSRTELFVGPTHHTTMGRLYEVRSSVEHLGNTLAHYPGSRFDKYLALWRDAVAAEELARAAIRRLVLQTTLWPHFREDTSLEAFWNDIEPHERGQLWGATEDLDQVMAAFQGEYLDPPDLGLTEADR